MASSAKGTKENPYSMSECDEMLDNGTWPGGYVKDDSGQVSYVTKSVTVWGYSGSGSGSEEHGSDFEFSTGSHEWHEPDDEENGSEEDGNRPPSGNEGDNQTDGNYGGGAGGGTGGSYNSNISYINNGTQGTYLYNAQYYTEKEYNHMQQEGTWTGGNVFTLGYIGKDYVINSGLSSIDSSDNWLTSLAGKAYELRNGLKRICNEVMSLSYVQAIGCYNSGTGKPLYLDAESIGLRNLIGCKTDNDNPDSKVITINLLTINNLDVMLSGKSLSEQIKILSTALTLGNITLNKVSDNTYTVVSDKYDFDIHDWDREPMRNVATMIGFAVSESLSIGMDFASSGPFGSVLCRSMDLALGLVRRHIRGTTEFKIYINGNVTWKR